MAHKNWDSHTKTHQITRIYAKIYFRDPFDSVLAEFNRRSGGHIGHASLEKFKKDSGKAWQDFVIQKVTEWEHMNMDWVTNFNKPLLVVFYSDLVDHLEDTLAKMLDFLNVSYSKENMECVLKRKEGIYRRKKKNGNLKSHVYNSFLTSVINKRKNKVLQFIKETNKLRWNWMESDIVKW